MGEEKGGERYSNGIKKPLGMSSLNTKRSRQTALLKLDDVNENSINLTAEGILGGQFSIEQYAQHLNIPHEIFQALMFYAEIGYQYKQEEYKAVVISTVKKIFSLVGLYAADVRETLDESKEVSKTYLAKLFPQDKKLGIFDPSDRSKFPQGFKIKFDQDYNLPCALGPMTQDTLDYVPLAQREFLLEEHLGTETFSMKWEKAKFQTNKYKVISESGTSSDLESATLVIYDVMSETSHPVIVFKTKVSKIVDGEIVIDSHAVIITDVDQLFNLQLGYSIVPMISAFSYVLEKAFGSVDKQQE